MLIWARRGLGLLLLVLALGFVGYSGLNRVFAYSESFTLATGAAAGPDIERIAERAVFNNARVEVLGHTGTLGDAAANTTLSQERADEIARQLKAVLPADWPISSLGVGAAQPLEREADESDRAYQRRLARVEIRLSPKA